MDIQEVKKQLNTKDTIAILHSLGVDVLRANGDALVFPTVCHNSIEDGGSDKLYYYNNSKLFNCYTECEGSFDLIELIQKIYLHSYSQEISIFEAINYIGAQINKDFSVTAPSFKTDSRDDISQFIKKLEQDDTLTVYDDVVLDVFTDVGVERMLGEGISKEMIQEKNVMVWLLILELRLLWGI